MAKMLTQSMTTMTITMTTNHAMKARSLMLTTPNIIDKK
jgi:hypothetical protein